MALYQKEILPFGSIHEYIKNYTCPGDYIIPICGNVDATVEHPVKNKIKRDPNDLKSLMEYDSKLLRVYKRIPKGIQLENIKCIDGAKNSGIKGRILSTANTFGNYLSKLGDMKSSIFCQILNGWYSSLFKSNNTPSTHIWIPVWDTYAEKCIVMNFFDKIEIIFS